MKIDDLLSEERDLKENKNVEKEKGDYIFKDYDKRFVL